VFLARRSGIVKAGLASFRKPAFVMTRFCGVTNRMAVEFLCQTSGVCDAQRLLETRLYLHAQEAHRVQDLGMRDQAAAIELGENAVDAEFLLQLA
jgi:hypothetical protein